MWLAILFSNIGWTCLKGFPLPTYDLMTNGKKPLRHKAAKSSKIRLFLKQASCTHWIIPEKEHFKCFSNGTLQYCITDSLAVGKLVPVQAYQFDKAVVPFKNSSFRFDQGILGATLLGDRWLLTNLIRLDRRILNKMNATRNYYITHRHCHRNNSERKTPI